MAITGRVNLVCNVNGRTYSGTVSEDADSDLAHAETVPAAASGTLSARGSTTAGTLTLEDGHGIQTANVLDMFWDGGSRYGVVAGTVNVDAVPISGGAGDDLPAQATAITACVRQSVVSNFVGDDLVLLCLQANKRCSVDFLNGAGASIKRYEFDANKAVFWAKDLGGVNNPFAGATVAALKLGNADSSAAASINIDALYTGV
jgi:hypothetical protein